MGNVERPMERRASARGWAAVARPLAPAATRRLTAVRDGKISPLASLGNTVPLTCYTIARKTTPVSVERIMSPLTVSVVRPTERRASARDLAAVARPLATAVIHRTTAGRGGEFEFSTTHLPFPRQEILLTRFALQQLGRLREPV